jgi:hypothetical protein
MRVWTPFMARCTRYTIMWHSLSGWLFSPGTLVFSTNKTDRHDITEKLLKVVLNTITHTHILMIIFPPYFSCYICLSWWTFCMCYWILMIEYSCMFYWFLMLECYMFYRCSTSESFWMFCWVWMLKCSCMIYWCSTLECSWMLYWIWMVECSCMFHWFLNIECSCVFYDFQP